MKKSKIIVATQDIVSPLRGGGGLRTVGTARAFRKRGYDVEILAPSDSENIGEISVKPLYQLSKTGSRLFSSFLFVLQLFFLLPKRVEQTRLIFIHNSVAAIPAIPLAKWYKVPLVLDVTDISTEYMYSVADSHLKRLVAMLLIFVEYLTFKFADRLIVVSKVMADHLAQKGIPKQKMNFVYDGAELDKLQNRSGLNDTFSFSVIHHGGIDARDGVMDIVEAADIVLQKFPKAKFYILGDGTCLTDVKKKVRYKGIEKAFVFTGWLPYSKMKVYLSKANIGIVSRTDTLPNHMVLTLKLLEYWASGTSVVSSAMKGIQEVATEGQNILFYEPGNPKDLAEKILILFRNQVLCDSIRQGGMDTVRQFNWPDLAIEIADLSLTE